VATALDAKLTPHESAAIAEVPTRNKAALDAYLQGQYHLKVYHRDWDRKEFQLASDSARQAIALDSGFADAYTLLARVSPDHAEAMAAVKQALSLAPDDADAHVAMAFLLSAQFDNDGAIAQAQQATLLQPSNWQVQQTLGMMFAHAGRFDEGIAALQRAVGLAPNETEPRVHLAGALVYVRRYAEARDVLQTVLAMDPDILTASIWLVVAYDDGWGDITASHRVLAAVKVPVASSYPLMSSWYWHDILARDFAGARAVVEQMPADRFKEYETPKGYYLGLTYALQSDHAHAKPFFRQAQAELEAWVKAAPEDADLHATLGEVLSGLGEHARALDEAHRAVALLPVSKSAESGPAYLGDLAYVEMCAGDTDAAIRQMRELLAIPAGTELSVAALRIDPEWDPIRDDPRFQALIKEYAAKREDPH
jgi:serine/threonine-protein kinase